MKIQLLKTNDFAIIPQKNHPEDAGFDIYSIENTVIPAKSSNTVDVGFEFAHIDPLYFVKIEGRSGLGFKHGIFPHYGIIDENYRGKAGVLLRNFSDIDYQVKKGDKIAQFVIYPRILVNIDWSEFKTESSRGEKGFGSSDIKNENTQIL